MIDEIRQQLAVARNAPAMQRIAKSIYPQVKKLSIADRYRLCSELFADSFAGGAVVCYLYRRFARQCGAREFKLFTGWLDRYVDNWGLTDGVSLWLLGASIANDPSLIDRLDAWTKSKNRWKRRAAAVALVPSARRGLNTNAIFRIAHPLMTDEDDMVQKAAGWLLKETYPKKPRETVKFLTPWRDKAPRLTLRYAAEKMTAKDRAFVLSRTL